MPMHQTMPNGFDTDLKTILPRLRVYALSLTRDRDLAEDLVQETAVKALAGRKSFRPGTNFAAWLFRIQRNEFISGVRRTRPTVCIDDAVTGTLSHPPQQESGLVMREFRGAFRRLSDGAREALLLAVLEGYSYKQIAEHGNVSIGTVKSRISRGRAALEQMLAGDDVDNGPDRTGEPAAKRSTASSLNAHGIAKPKRSWSHHGGFPGPVFVPPRRVASRHLPLRGLPAGGSRGPPEPAPSAGVESLRN